MLANLPSSCKRRTTHLCSKLTKGKNELLSKLHSINPLILLTFFKKVEIVFDEFSSLSFFKVRVF